MAIGRHSGGVECEYLLDGGALSFFLDFSTQPWTKHLDIVVILAILACSTSTSNRKISITNKAMARRFLALERGKSVQLSLFLAKIPILEPYFAQKLGLKFCYFSNKYVALISITSNNYAISLPMSNMICAGLNEGYEKWLHLHTRGLTENIAYLRHFYLG